MSVLTPARLRELVPGFDDVDDETVQKAIDEAERLIAEHIGRKRLELGEITERRRLYNEPGTGRRVVYPSHTPVVTPPVNWELAGPVKLIAPERPFGDLGGGELFLDGGAP